MKYKNSLLPFLSIFFLGCNQIPQIPQPSVPKQKSNFISPDDSNLSVPLDENKTIQQIKQVPQKAPKKHIKLKKVEDQNFSPDYMYPTENKPKKEKPIEVKQTKVQNDTMSIAECISMIGQDRFNRYTQMLGSQDAALKRCQMIKAQG
jgi:hypothetical protein